MKLQDLDTLRVGDLIRYNTGTYLYRVDYVWRGGDALGAGLIFHLVTPMPSDHYLVSGNGHVIAEFDGSMDVHLPDLSKVVA